MKTQQQIISASLKGQTMGETIGLIINVLLVICVVLSAHYLGQIRDILKDIRDNRTPKTSRSHYSQNVP